MKINKNSIFAYNELLIILLQIEFTRRQSKQIHKRIEI